MNDFSWIDFSSKIKSRYLTIAPHMWWGDDLDVRFYLIKQLAALKNKKILDVGCNIGIIISFLDKSNDTYGIDINEECISKAKELNPASNITKTSMDNLEMYENGFFDIIIMSNVLPGFDFGVQENRDTFIYKTFREMSRILSDSGKIYFTTPNGESVHYKSSNKVNHSLLKKYFNETELAGKIKGWNSISPICPKGMVNSRLKNKYKFIPHKVLCKFNFVWNKLIADMDEKVLESKFFYAELYKKKA
ncbi:MAG: methyltransferase domain-containing protein [Eubacteriales bacterium]|nr:methyltransferase domain-containing protein [Eubacteriales bacterium]